jgi:putative Mg2+ transporter-C (MgtC) family protein
VGSALFMLVSKYGFGDLVLTGKVSLDPSRVAAQIVSGVGFLGAGLIFVQRGSVRGLTTAAAVWVVAAVGAAAAAGLPILAALTTAIYFLVALAFPQLTRRLPRSATAISAIQVRYPDGRGILRRVLAAATDRDFTIDGVVTEASPGGRRTRTIELTMHVHGRAPVDELVAALSELDDVEAVQAVDMAEED